MKLAEDKNAGNFWRQLAEFRRSEWFCVHFRGGFTLVEMLVVIAIVGVLASMVLPGVRGARRMADRIEAAAKMKTIGVAINQYRLDHHGALPGPLIYGQYTVPTPNLNRGRLSSFLYDYLPGSAPEDRGKPDPRYVSRIWLRWLERNNYADGHAYIVNTAPVGRNGDTLAPWGYPANYTADGLGISSDAAAYIFEQLDAARIWAVAENVNPGRWVTPDYDELYDGRNILYFDGHVESLPYDQM
jgi:prepilin-type N-terminal cleavage/methylation domain-containing protein/prepilin-type processing-associated H-X9-DG protein